MPGVEGEASAIDLEELQRAVAAAEPAALVVPRRILRRVIMKDRGLRFFGGAAVRRDGYAVSGRALAGAVTAHELGWPPATPWPDVVYLLERPTPEDQEARPGSELLTDLWRRLFRLRVRQTVIDASLNGRLGPGELGKRAEAIGRTEYEEAQKVLRDDEETLDGDSPADVYATFAAVFLDLTTFAPRQCAVTFPAIEDTEHVARVFGRDVPTSELLKATRPPGAISPSDPAPAGESPEGAGPGTRGFSFTTLLPVALPQAPHKNPLQAGKLAASAERVAEKGNNVRAALLWTRAAEVARGDEAVEHYRAEGRGELKRLADRLQKALFVRRGEAELWADALAPLLRHAVGGFWTPEARLLFDLQKVCLDHEREVYRLEPIGWLLSFGKRSLMTQLPHLREVTMSNHLRSAANRLARLTVSRDERTRLELLLRPAVEHAGEALRDRFRPRVQASLDAAWVKPNCAVERVAYRKLVEEVLDQVVAKGFSTLGDLRDSASKSDLKMPDLAGARELLGRDRLLATDRELARQLDGVYRPGEIYLRAFQRFSSLAFGTKVGRFITRYIALPYGGSFMLLKGLEEIVYFVSLGVAMVGNLAHRHWHGVHLQTVNVWSVLMLGTVALGAINFTTFRAGFFKALGYLGRWARGALVDLPATILFNPVLQRIIRSRAMFTAWQLALKPGLVALGAWFLLRLLGGGEPGSGWVAILTFAVAEFVFNTSAGQVAEEVVLEEVGRALHGLTFEFLPGLFHAVMWLFEKLLDQVEKLIYAVDEWLRFRSGQSALVLGVKAVLGTVWAVLAYLIRIYANLLIEPQVNPIKHFPVVTVSHKVILPLTIKLAVLLTAMLTPFLGRDLGALVAGVNVLLFPGIFGFLAWELKSNWRLYEANRPLTLRPLAIGSHGETVLGLLRPAFHSGTLPKNYAKLRRARKAGRERVVVKRRESIHHVEEAVRRFIDRDLAGLLDESRALGDYSIRPGSIRLATNRIRVELISDAFDAPPLTLDLEERPGRLAAGLSQTGWLSELEHPERKTLDAGLLGFLKLSAVESVEPPESPSDSTSGLHLRDVPVKWAEWAAFWDSERQGERVAPAWPFVIEAGKVPEEASKGSVVF